MPTLRARNHPPDRVAANLEALPSAILSAHLHSLRVQVYDFTLHSLCPFYLLWGDRAESNRHLQGHNLVLVH